jgi:hypothetical protein
LAQYSASIPSTTRSSITEQIGLQRKLRHLEVPVCMVNQIPTDLRAILRVISEQFRESCRVRNFQRAV